MHVLDEETPEGRIWVTRRQVADYLGSSVPTIDRYMKDGYLTAYRFAGSKIIRLDLNEVERMMIATAGTGHDHNAAQ